MGLLLNPPNIYPFEPRDGYQRTRLDVGTLGHVGDAVRPLAFHATWSLLSTCHPNITFHVALLLRDSLYASNIRYNGLHLLSGSYGHADRPDPA